MAKFLISEGRYYAQLDEAAFFGWLQAISGVTKVEGTQAGLVVHLRTSRLSEAALRDLLALHFRYGLSMHSLAQFETPRNTSWFKAPDAYWYENVFGKSTAA